MSKRAQLELMSEIISDSDYYMPWRALLSIGRILNTDGAKKHGDSWKERPDHIDYDAAARHKIKAEDAEHSNYDLDSGELHEAHRIARLLFPLERRLIALEAAKSPVMASMEDEQEEA